MRSKPYCTAILLLTLAWLLSPMRSLAGPAHAPAAPPSKQEAYDIGLEAFLYFYPLVAMDLTRRQSTNASPGTGQAGAPMNAFSHVRAYPATPGVQQNFDTLVSSAWLDLTRGPVVVSVPETHGRYYFLSMLDMWSDVFAAPGKRTIGTRAADFVLVPSGWHGRLPPDVMRINAPTSMVWINGRTQAQGPGDYDAVHKIQDGFKATPIAWWRGRALLPAPVKTEQRPESKSSPKEEINKMAAGDYFRYAAELAKVNPPHISDWSIVARMKRVGLEIGKRFEIDKLDPAFTEALSQAVNDGKRLMALKSAPATRLVNGWQRPAQPTGVYGDDYFNRAITAMDGLGAHQPEDMVELRNSTDAKGNALDGANSYAWHLAKGGPPTSAFWSITVYDSRGRPVENPLKRFALSSLMPLKPNPDGSLDLYLQNASPGADKEPNWLPTPKGAFSLTLRLYAPSYQVLTGEWAPPALTVSEAQSAGRSP